MAKSEIEIGPAGKLVAEKVRQTRNDVHHWTLAQLSERTEAIGRRLSVSALSLIETGKRRIDVDDLVTLADALEVRASSLLGEPQPNRAPIYADPVLMREFAQHTGEFFRRWEAEHPDPSPDEIADDTPDEFNNRK